jgi:heme oxygenase
MMCRVPAGCSSSLNGPLLAKCESMKESPETIHTRLRRETRALHQEVEQALPLLEPGLTLDRYRDVLRRFHGFYAPHEERMAPLASQLPFPMRRRAALLVQDLRALGLSVHDLEALPRCAVPPLTQIDQLAGWLYVFEGASLGGQIVARALRDNLGLHATSGSAFFLGEGAATLPRWRQVLSWLEEVCAARAEPEAVSASACGTFLRLRSWLEGPRG